MDGIFALSDIKKASRLFENGMPLSAVGQFSVIV